MHPGECFNGSDYRPRYRWSSVRCDCVHHHRATQEHGGKAQARALSLRFGTANFWSGGMLRLLRRGLIRDGSRRPVVRVNVALCLNTGGIQLARPGRPESSVA